jgi:hypothetical protein
MIDKGIMYTLQEKGRQKKSAASYKKRGRHGMMKRRSWKKRRK